MTVLQELREHRSGGQIAKLRLAKLFVDVMRRYLESLPSGQTGWLAGLRDPLIGRALALLHKAEAAFSRAFKRCVGLSPDEWRRQRAS